MPAEVKKAPIGQIPSMPYDAFLEKMPARGRTNFVRYIDSLSTAADAQHRDLLVRLVGVLSGLASHAIEVTGQLAMQFYIADGKHRLQVFALEDTRAGVINLYLPDCISQAVKQKIIVASDEGGIYEVPAQPGSTLRIDKLTAATTGGAPEFFKHMLGWNRKAIRVELPVTAPPGEILAVEQLFVLGAQLRAPEGAPAAKK